MSEQRFERWLMAQQQGQVKETTITFIAKPIDENTPKDRAIMLYNSNRWQVARWHAQVGRFLDMKSFEISPTHWCEISDMAVKP